MSACAVAIESWLRGDLVCVSVVEAVNLVARGVFLAVDVPLFPLRRILGEIWYFILCSYPNGSATGKTELISFLIELGLSSPPYYSCI